MKRVRLACFMSLLALWIAALWSPGCRRPLEEGRNEQFLAVLDDPSELAAARLQADRSRPAAGSAEALVAEWSSWHEAPDSSIDHATVVPALFSLAHDRTKDPRTRSNAASLLLLIDPASGQDTILSLLREDKGECRRAMLLALSFMSFIDEETATFDNRDLIGLLLGLIEDAADGDLAIGVCGHLKLSGTIPALWRALARAEGRRRGEVLYWLARLQPDRRTFDIILRSLKSPDEVLQGRALDALTHFFDIRDSVLARDAIEVAADGILSRITAEGANAWSMPQSICAEVLRRGAGEKARALADAILASSADRYLRSCAYTAARRREGPRSVERITKDLAGDDAFWLSVRAASEIFAGTHDARVISALRDQIRRRREQKELVGLAQALIEIGGDRVEADVREIAMRVTEPDRMQLLLTLDRRSPLEIARSLSAAGIVSVSPETLVAETNARGEDDVVESLDAGPRLFDLLQGAGVLYSFDAETGEVPVRHDELIEELGRSSGGHFRPEACFERMLEESENDWDAPYEVQFIHAGRLYRFTARNLGDWYDVERVIVACNRALADGGSSRRFVPVAEDDQIATFICLSPDQRDFLATRSGVAFDDTFDSAMRQGKEFEEEVLRSLEQSGAE